MMWRDRKSEPLPQRSSLDPQQVARFSAMAEEWWDPDGNFRTLHTLNPVRLAYIRTQVCQRLGRDAAADLPFAGLDVLDIGCGGGLLCEPVAFWGARVLGIDASAKLIEVARLHAALVGAPVIYRHGLVEDLVADGLRFDVILNTEVVEHVADQNGFLAGCCRLLKPGGVMVVATLNRTAKSFLFAKIGGEYILNLLPKGTHDWRRFVKPEELAVSLARFGVVVDDMVGVAFNPIFHSFRLTKDLNVNYMAIARRPALRVAAADGKAAEGAP